MKKIIITAILLITMQSSMAQVNPAEQLAEKIAQKMKDSLGLSAQQKDSIYSINMFLHQRKLVKRQQYTNMDSLALHLQKVEVTRDSLYRGVLPIEKFNEYLLKKNILISNN